MNRELLKIDDRELIPETWNPVTLEMSVDKESRKALINIAPRLDRWFLANADGSGILPPKTATHSSDWTIWLDKPRLLQFRGAIDAALAEIES